MVFATLNLGQVMEYGMQYTVDVCLYKKMREPLAFSIHPPWMVTI